MPAKQSPGDPAEKPKRKPLNRCCQWCGAKGGIFKLTQKFCGRACQYADYAERKRKDRREVVLCPTCQQRLRNPRGRPRKDGAVKQKAPRS